MTDLIRWQAIREANAVPGSSDPAVWRAAYRAACIVRMAKALGMPLTSWQEAWLRELIAPEYRCPTTALRVWPGRVVREIHA